MIHAFGMILSYEMQRNRIFDNKKKKPIAENQKKKNHLMLSICDMTKPLSVLHVWEI